MIAPVSMTTEERLMAGWVGRSMLKHSPMLQLSLIILMSYISGHTKNRHTPTHTDEPTYTFVETSFMCI